jgi:GNAT superfamily N-acetyltransferase
MAEESHMRLRAMHPADWSEVADLICVSTNYWYQASGKPPIFRGGPAATRLFCEVYEALDPGCCVIAEDSSTGRIAGSCFYHPRPTHVSLGIMNVHPNYFSLGVAHRLLRFITDFADDKKLPVRLVSSAMNLDSFSLYTRAGFVPRAAFQDMYLPPGNKLPATVAGTERVREARLEDVPAMAALEADVAHIQRDRDFRFFIENAQNIWHTLVIENGDGQIAGFLASVNHPGSNMLGPGVMRTPADAAALIWSQLKHHRRRHPVFLVPVDEAPLVRQLYDWGARNCELHFCQVRGPWSPFGGIVMPTFMSETG